MALKIAKEKLCTHPEWKHFPHYTFVVQNNKIIEWATNGPNPPPIHYGYQQLGRQDNGYRPKLHAEIAAYRRARGLIGKKPFEIINVRLNRSQETRISKSCPCCFNILHELGCSRFYYSSNSGFLKIS